MQTRLVARPAIKSFHTFRSLLGLPLLEFSVLAVPPAGPPIVGQRIHQSGQLRSHQDVLSLESHRGSMEQLAALDRSHTSCLSRLLALDH
jgi:hypothetical protein